MDDDCTVWRSLSAIDGLAFVTGLQPPRAEFGRLASHRLIIDCEQIQFFRDNRRMKGYLRASRISLRRSICNAAAASSTVMVSSTLHA